MNVLKPEQIKREIKMAKIEKQIQTLEAENHFLKQEVKRLEEMLCERFPPLNEPIQVIGSWHTTKGAGV